MFEQELEKSVAKSISQLLHNTACKEHTDAFFKLVSLFASNPKDRWFDSLQGI